MAGTGHVTNILRAATTRSTARRNDKIHRLRRLNISARQSAVGGQVGRGVGVNRGRREPARRDSVTGSVIEEVVHGSVYELGEEIDEVLIPRPTVSARVWDQERRGIGALKWVESDCFERVVCLAIVCNVALMSVTSKVKSGNTDLDWLDWHQTASNFLLCVFLLELLLRFIHFGPKRFWIDCDAGSLLNVLDFVAELFAAVDAWFIGASSGPSPWLLMRVFRLLQKRWLLELQRIFCGDLAWTESDWWQWFIGGVIFVNAILMGLETEMPSDGWEPFENAILAFFTVEITLRLRRHGFQNFFAGGEDQFWNLLDSMIVVTGVLDLWILQLIAHLMDGNAGAGDRQPSLARIMMLMRLLRLMRILRLLRLVKTVRPLYQLSSGILSAMQGMFWVLMLTLVCLYAFALVTTTFFGDNSVIEAYKDASPQQSQLFGTVLTSMFTLFGLMTGQYWSAVSPILNQFPVMKPFYVLFIILSSWALLSIMTSVVSDNMTRIRIELEKKDIELIGEFRSKLQNTMINRISNHGLATQEGFLEKSVLRDMLISFSNSTSEKQKEHLRVNAQTNNELHKMLDWLDVGRTGLIEIDDFLQGLDWLNSVVTGRTLLQFEVSIKRRCNGLERLIKNVMSDVQAMGAERQVQTQETIHLLTRIQERYDLAAAMEKQKAEALLAEEQSIKEQIAKLTNNMSKLRSSFLEPMMSESRRHAFVAPLQRISAHLAPRHEQSP